MNEYERLRLAGEFVRQGLQKESGSAIPPILSGGVLLPRSRKRRRSTRDKIIASRPYYDVETGRFL